LEKVDEKVKDSHQEEDKEKVDEKVKDSHQEKDKEKVDEKVKDSHQEEDKEKVDEKVKDSHQEENKEKVDEKVKDSHQEEWARSVRYCMLCFFTLFLFFSKGPIFSIFLHFSLLQSEKIHRKFSFHFFRFHPFFWHFPTLKEPPILPSSFSLFFSHVIHFEILKYVIILRFNNGSGKIKRGK
jgi:cation transport ATPase